VIVIHEPNPLGLVSHFLMRPPGRLVVWFHSEVVRQRWLYMLYRPFLRRTLRRADRVIVSSPKLIEHAKELQEFQWKCEVIPFGINAERLQCTATIAHRAERLRSELRPPILLFVGRMVGYKGLDVLLRALCALDATAVLVGAGPRLASLKNLASDLGVRERVVFAGEVEDDEIVALYHACDVFVLPSVSRNEAFGVVQLEAMACGKPVVSTNLPSGVPWVNRHGETGFVVPPGDVVALRDALARLLDDPELRDRMGKRGRERVMTEFTLERMASRTTALYHAILSGHASVSTSPNQSSSGEKVRLS
jgi:rhamnosyl/mannosyltransferase